MMQSDSSLARFSSGLFSPTPGASFHDRWVNDDHRTWKIGKNDFRHIMPLEALEANKMSDINQGWPLVQSSNPDRFSVIHNGRVVDDKLWTREEQRFTNGFGRGDTNFSNDRNYRTKSDGSKLSIDLNEEEASGISHTATQWYRAPVTVDRPYPQQLQYPPKSSNVTSLNAVMSDPNSLDVTVRHSIQGESLLSRIDMKPVQIKSILVKRESLDQQPNINNHVTTIYENTSIERPGSPQISTEHFTNYQPGLDYVQPMSQSLHAGQSQGFLRIPTSDTISERLRRNDEIRPEKPSVQISRFSSQGSSHVLSGEPSDKTCIGGMCALSQPCTGGMCSLHQRSTGPAFSGGMCTLPQKCSGGVCYIGQNYG